MATPCNCDTFTGPITINDGSLTIAGYSGGGDSLAVGGAININGQTLRNAGTFTLCNGCTTYSWMDNAGGTTWMVLTDAGQLGIGTTSPQQALDVNGTVRATGLLLGGDILLFGALKDSTGTRTNVDAGGCYYAS